MTRDPTLVREAATEALSGVLRQKLSLTEAWNRSSTRSQIAKLSQRDRAFARMITATCLRRLGQVDAVLRTFLDKPLPARAGPVMDILRIAATQILFMAVKPHAAVNEAVDQARGHQAGKHYTGLVNAILRRVVTEGPSLIATQDANTLNAPQWLLESWWRAYGAETARAICEAHLQEPPLDLSMNSTDPEVLFLAAEQFDGEVLRNGTVRTKIRGRIEAIPGYAEGNWWIQDVAAALPVRAMGPVRDQTVIELCAAPGGKTAQLIARGADVIAVDKSLKRTALLQENLIRLNYSADLITADACSWRPDEPAARVLLDAPCTATGTIRRHPDIPWLKTPDTVTAMAKQQSQLLDAAVDMLAPGGLLIYAVCSLQPEEGPEQISALLDRGAPIERAPIKPGLIGGMHELITPEGDIRTLPCHLADQGGMDAFFVSRLRKR